MEKTFAVTFVVPVTVNQTGDQPDYEEMTKAVHKTALRKLSEGHYAPVSMEEISETVSEDTPGKDQVPGVHNTGTEIHNEVGTPGKQEDSDLSKNMQGYESGKKERNYSKPTSYSGVESKGGHQEKRGLHVDKTI